MKTFFKRKLPPSEPRELSAAEEFAVQWLEQHEFEYKIVFQNPQKTKFHVSKGETVYSLEVEREDPEIAVNMRKFGILFDMVVLTREIEAERPRGIRRYFSACNSCPHYREEKDSCELGYKTYFLTFFPRTKCPKCKDAVESYKWNKIIKDIWCGL